MAYGFFRGGLAETERDAAERRQDDVEQARSGSPRGRPDSAGIGGQPGAADASAAQAEMDIATIVGTLLEARKANNAAEYRRAEAAMLPVLTRSIATAISARRAVPLGQALGLAQNLTQALVARLDAGTSAPAMPMSDVEARGQSAARSPPRSRRRRYRHRPPALFPRLSRPAGSTLDG